MAHGGLDPNAWREIFKTEAANLEEEKKHIWDLEFDDSITPKWPQQGWSVCNWKTSGRFQCDLCRRTWPSNLVKVVFIMRLKNGRGIVKTRLYRQNCKICKNAPMVKPGIDSTNIHSLMQSLVKKIRRKWYEEGQDQGNPHFERIEVNQQHEPRHCEACIEGYCAQMEYY